MAKLGQRSGKAESAAVAAGSNQLALGKRATTLVILNQFKSRKSFNSL